MITSKQGVELEGYVQLLHNYEKEDLFVHREACGRFESDVNSSYYFDDSKPEYPSKPFVSLKSLANDVIGTISQSLDICEEERWLYSLIGCHPYQQGFASAHVHNSISKNPTKKEEQEIRKKLFSLQPFIALLSMNSPIMNGNIAPVKSVRMAYGTWGDFTNYDAKSTSHYMALATGRKAYTLEVRIPSSCGLYQLLGITAFIKTIISFDDIPILPITYVEDLFYKTIKFGGEAITPLINPNKIGYLGFKGKTVYVKISDLFNQFLEDEDIKDRLNKILSELPAYIRSNIYKFYKIIAEGYTISDYILHFYNKVRGDRREVLNLLSDISLSYKYKAPMFSFLEQPKNPIMPKINTTLSIQELEKMLQEENFYNIQDEIGVEREELDHVLYTHKHSLKKNKFVRSIISSLLSNSAIPSSNVDSSIRNFLLNNNVLKYDENSRNLLQGSKFSYIAQIARDEKLL